MPYGAIPRTTETEPETETETDTETENRNGNGTFNIHDFGLSTRIRSFVRVIFSVCLSVYFLDIWRFLYLPIYYINEDYRSVTLPDPNFNSSPISIQFLDHSQIIVTFITK